MREVTTKTTYLEMRSPVRNDTATPEGVAVAHVEKPSLAEYRHYYSSVGKDFDWVDRILLADEKLVEIIHDNLVEISLLTVGGEPAGFSELDRRTPTEIELAYFGLFPNFIGRGLGKFFLNWTVQHAWSYQPNRVWVHTCDLDHPAALPNYVRAGFQVYDEKIVHQQVAD